MKNEKEINWMFILANVWTVVFYICYMFEAPNFPEIPLVSFNPFKFSVFIFFIIYWYVSFVFFVTILVENLMKVFKK